MTDFYLIDGNSIPVIVILQEKSQRSAPEIDASRGRTASQETDTIQNVEPYP
jgi:hypothetical protein